MITIFVRLSISDVCGSLRYPRYAPICWQYTTKVSILDTLSDPRSAYVTDTMIPFSKWLFSLQSACLGCQAFVCLSKILKHKVTWSKNSILVVTVALDSGHFKFAWGECLKKASPLNPSKSGRLAEDQTFTVWKVSKYGVISFFFFFSFWILFHEHSRITGPKGKGGKHFFNSSLPFPPSSQTLRH